MGDPALKLEDRFTYKEYKSWPEDERWELIRGEPFRMQSPTTEMNLWFKGRPCQPFIAPVDVLLREVADQPEDEVDTIVEPDLIVVCDPDKVKRNGIHGAPDWVLHPDTLDLLIYRLDSGRFGAPIGATLKSPVEVVLFPGLVLGPTSA